MNAFNVLVTDGFLFKQQKTDIGNAHSPISGYKWGVAKMQYKSRWFLLLFSHPRSVFPRLTSHPFGNTLNVNTASKLSSYLVSTHCWPLDII